MGSSIVGAQFRTEMSDLLRFLLQVSVILGVSRAAAVALKRAGQPPVIGEVIAGILLGPTLFGWIAPGPWSELFPPATLPMLSTVSQLGLILFMFLVGLRLDPSHLRHHKSAAAVISITGILVPFCGGIALAQFLRQDLAPAGVNPLAFSFFLGVAMSITAFPVLARILSDTGLLETRLGAMVISCAAVDDIIAWMLLATGVALANPAAQQNGLLQISLSLMAYAGVMALGGRAMSYLDPGGSARVSLDRLGLIVLVGLLSAAATEWIGIHALFGAFFAGVTMPKRRDFVTQVCAMLEPVAAIVLLPVFFAYTGLRMTIPIVETRMWVYGALILAVAIVGKWGGALIAARVAGFGWRDSASIGVLMNTRGLVELVVLNLGMDLRILTPALFSLMVFMALITTGMATPLLRLLAPLELNRGCARPVAEIEPIN